MPEPETTAVARARLVMRQPAHEPEQEEAKQPAAQVQRDPLAQVGDRAGDAMAGVHAASLSRATDGRPGRAAGSLLRLQCMYGNRYVSRVVELSRKDQGDGNVTPEIEADIQRERGGGQALDSGARAQMEPALGADFSGVRVHTGGQADVLNRDLSARAFTTGQDIFFKQGEYSPGSSSGRELLAHELTHVVQQGGDRVKRKLTVGAVDDPCEQEADRTAGQVMRSIGAAAQRQSMPEEEEKKEEPLQAKLDEGGVQRQAEEEEKKEEEPVQMKPEEGSLHRQAEEEKEEEKEEEPVQAKLDDGQVQREAEEEEEEEEEPVQAKSDGDQVQRQAEEEEEEEELLQAKPDDGQVQRQGGKKGKQKTKARRELLGDFRAKFPKSAKLIRGSKAAMKLLKAAGAAGVKFGGFAEAGPGHNAWAYTIGDTVYVPQARVDEVLAMSDFLFELNNAIRKPKFAALEKEAAKGAGGKLTAEDYAYKTVEQEVEGMLRLGEVWFETKKTSGKEADWGKYDADFYLSEYQAFKNGDKKKDDLVKDVLQRVYTSGANNGKTVKQFYEEQFKEIRGG